MSEDELTMDGRNDMDVIRRRLTRLRLGLRLWQCGVGISRLLVVLAGLVLLSFIVDRCARMDHTQRVLSLLIGVVVLLVVVWRWMIRPLLRRVSAEALLLRVERRQADLVNRLMAAWEFAAMPDTPPGASPALVASAIEQGCAAAQRTDFYGVLDWPRFWRRARLGGLALATLLALAIGAPQTMQRWFYRNILLRDIEWPRQTHLQVQGLVNGGLQVPVAGDLELLVRAEGVQPDEVVFRYADKSGAAYSEQMPQIGESYRALFRGVTEPFRLQVSGGDDRTAWIPVRLLPRPEITNVTVTVEPPAYTGRKRTTLDTRVGQYTAPAGSSIILGGRASLPLREVDVAIEGNRLQMLRLTNAENFAIRLPPEQVKTATYRLQAVSESGIATLRATPVGLRVEPDRPPRVTARLEGIGQLVLPRAVVPVVGELQDDYGVAAAWLEYQSQSPTGQNSGMLQAPLALPATPPTGGVVRVDCAFELAPLRLEPDATLSLRIAARDGNTLSGPGQGQSANYTLRVVTESELRQDLTRREQALRQRLERLIQEQRVLADEARVFHAGTEVIKDQGAARSLQVEKRQRQVQPALATIIAGLAQIRHEAYNNRLESLPAPLVKRLDEAVLAPLRDVAATLLPEAAERAAAARQRTDDAAWRAAWRNTESTQRRVIKALLDVRKNLQASEDVSELMRLLEEVLSNQKNVNRETERKAARAIESIFEK
ncbi:MAG: hypothetical protein ACOYOU_07605 [Kiritimatiellia bacterium]